MTTKPIVRVPAGSSRINDGLMNVIQGAGTSRDRQQYARYNYGYVDQAEIEAAYITSGLCRKIHDIPPFEMTREGRDWQAQDIDIAALEKLERSLGVWDKVREALITARLTGGAVIVMGLPGNSDTPARIGGRNSLRYLTVLSRNQINIGPIQRQLNLPGFGEPTYYEYQAKGATQRVHPSRVIPFIAQKRPPGSMYAGGHEFWGDPLLLSIEMALKNNDSAYQNLAALLGESKVDTVTIPGLSDRLATAEYESALIKRLAVAQMFQSQFNMRLIEGGATDNAPSEKWETRQISFAGLPEVVRTFGVFLAGVVDIPYARLFGESPGGLNSTGKNEQVDFERMIRSKQNVELRPALERLDDYLIPSALGTRPSDIYWTFSPLSVMNEIEAATVEKTDAEALKIYVDAGVIPSEVASEAVKNRLIEGGRFPGIEKAYSDYAAGLLVPDLDEGDEPEPERVVAANDALPRPLYVQRKLVNTAEFIAWAKSQGFKTVTDAGDLHVTVTFSRTPVDWMKMGENWSSDQNGNLTIEPGGARIVEPLGDQGAVVLLFNSSALSYRNMHMRENGASWDYPEYQPHVTITYDAGDLDLSKVEPYRGKLVFGPEIFEELTDDWRPSES